MIAHAGNARFVIPCVCGVQTPFTNEQRGSAVECSCKRVYWIPYESGPLTRLAGYLRWKWRAFRAPTKRERSTGPTYRSTAPRIACPGCDAIPGPTWEWTCAFCVCSWDTFATRGECPHCAFVYPATECLACKKLYRHADWYAD